MSPFFRIFVIWLNTMTPSMRWRCHRWETYRRCPSLGVWCLSVSTSVDVRMCPLLWTSPMKMGMLMVRIVLPITRYTYTLSSLTTSKILSRPSSMSTSTLYNPYPRSMINLWDNISSTHVTHSNDKRYITKTNMVEHYGIPSVPSYSRGLFFTSSLTISWPQSINILGVNPSNKL